MLKFSACITVYICRANKKTHKMLLLNKYLLDKGNMPIKRINLAISSFSAISKLFNPPDI